MTAREEQVDVAVVGGGPAGAAAALTLTRHTDLRVALIERSEYADWRVGESLPPGARGLLDYLGVLDLVTGAPHRSASGMQAAWGGEALAATDFVFSAQGPGWHLDRARFDAALAARAGERGALLLTGTSARSAGRGADGAWRLALSSATGVGPPALRARFVIDASGRTATVARRCGARRRRDDRLVGVLGVVGPDREAARVAGTLVEADRDGWWYATPAGPDRVVVARMTDADLARAEGLLDPLVWLARLRRTRHLAARVGSVRPAGPLAVRPSFSQCTLPLCGPGWLAAGEAAVAFDPLSGMGIGYALASGIESARAAAACIDGREDVRASFACAVGEHYRRYLQRRSATYAVERRWLQSPFWARRQVPRRRPDRPL